MPSASQVLPQLVGVDGLARDADDAYLALRGLRTLSVRLRQHEINATAVAHWLAAHPQVERVYYPALESHPGHALWKRDCRGANGLLTVQFRGFSQQQSLAAADGLRLFDIGASWGGYESFGAPGRATPAGPPCRGSERRGAAAVAHRSGRARRPD